MEAEVIEEVSRIPLYILMETEPKFNYDLQCQFCNRIGEWWISTQLNNQPKEYWVCGQCPESKILMDKWRIS